MYHHGGAYLFPAVVHGCQFVFTVTTGNGGFRGCCPLAGVRQAGSIMNHRFISPADPRVAHGAEHRDGGPCRAPFALTAPCLPVQC